MVYAFESGMKKEFFVWSKGQVLVTRRCREERRGEGACRCVGRDTVFFFFVAPSRNTSEKGKTCLARFWLLIEMHVSLVAPPGQCYW